MKSWEEPIWFYSACRLYEHLFFEGHGPSPETALAALRGALTVHARRIGLPRVEGRYPWVEAIIDEILAENRIEKRALGFGYLDDEKVFEL
jgi:hypothetical protein